MSILKAEALTTLGDYLGALKTLEPGPPQGKECASQRVRRLKDQASIYFSLGNYSSTNQLLEVAERQAKEVTPVDPNMISEINFAKVHLYAKTGDLDDAGKTLDELARMPGAVDRAHLLNAYGYVSQQFARYEQAAKYYEAALLENGVTPLDQGEYQSNLASIYYHLGDLEQARSAALKAREALEKSGDRAGLRVCLNTLGIIYSDTSDFARARENLDRALQIAEELKDNPAAIEVENNLALVAIDNHEWNKAEELNRRALEAEAEQDDRESRQYSRIAEARILAGKRQFQGALTVLDELTGHPFRNPTLSIDAEVEYIDIFRQLLDETKAREHYQKARLLSENVRSQMHTEENKLAWFDSQNQLNQEWVRFLIETNHVEEALEAAESSRARLMLERLDRNVRPVSHTSAYNALARSQGTLVSYWLMPDVSYAWVVTADKIEICKLPGERAIASMVVRYQSFIEGGNDPLNSAIGKDLEQAILEPLLPLLYGAKRIVLVPDAQLNALNFETLPVDGHYWIESVTLTIAPALDVLSGSANSQQPGPTSNSILAIGDPTPIPEFPKLQNAARELDNVSQDFSTSDVLRGSAATPAEYLKAAHGYRYIHFAAHASAIADHPLDSAVILSSGRLTAHELLQNPIHAELVTISACRSAGVRSYHGEGLVGLAWVFLQTGAHGVIAGLWDASDYATADLMTGLYRRISQGEHPATALHEAKLEMIHTNSRFASPYYWGPFQYYRGSSR